MRKWLKWIDQCCCEVCNLFPQKIYFEHFTLNKEVRIETPTQKSRHPLFAEHQQLPKSSDSEMRRFQVLIDSIFTERPNSPIMCLHHWFWCYSIIFIYTFIISYYCTYILYRIYIYSHHTVTDTETSDMWREIFVAFFVVKSSIVFLQVTCAKCDAEVPSVRCDGTTGLAIVLS